MKLVIATPLYPPEIGGPATHAKLLVEGLPKVGIEVELVKFSEVRHLPKLIRHHTYYRRVLKAARSADAVLALDPVSVGLPAMWAAKKAGKPFVVKIVGDYAWEQGRQRFGVEQSLDEFVKMERVPFLVRMLRRIQTRVALYATRVIVPSEYLKRIVATWDASTSLSTGIPEEKIHVIYNGIELPTHIPTHQKNDGEFLIVSAGRRVPWKGFEAIEHIAREHTNWRVCIASGLSRIEALGWIQAADVFVLNSSYEGLSHVLIEALALGAPIIATRAGGNPEVITNEENGLLVPVGDTQELARALARALGDGELRARLSARAKESAKRFSVETMLSATATALKNL